MDKSRGKSQRERLSETTLRRASEIIAFDEQQPGKPTHEEDQNGKGEERKMDESLEPEVRVVGCRIDDHCHVDSLVGGFLIGWWG